MLSVRDCTAAHFWTALTLFVCTATTVDAYEYSANQNDQLTEAQMFNDATLTNNTIEFRPMFQYVAFPCSHLPHQTRP